MVNILKWNSAILLLRAAAFIGMWYTSTSNPLDTALVASSVAAILFCLGPFLSSSLPNRIILLCGGASLASHLTRAVPGLVPFFLHPSVPPIFIVLTVLLFVVGFSIFSLIAAREEKKMGAVEPYWALFIAALPPELGVAFGGALYFLVFKPRVAQA